MSIAFPYVRVGEPVRYEALTVFPLFTDGHSPLDYWLSDEAIQAETVSVTEVSEDRPRD